MPPIGERGSGSSVLSHHVIFCTTVNGGYLAQDSCRCDLIVWGLV